MFRPLLFLPLLLTGFGSLHAAPAAHLVRASFFGGPGIDTIRHAAFDAEGSLWIAGNADSGPGEAARMAFPEDRTSSYGSSFVARLSPDLSKIAAILWTPPGGVELTTILPAKECVYVAGYATPALEPLAEQCAGVVRTATKGQKGLALFTPAEHYSHPKIDLTQDERGTPFVARLSRDLSRVESFTFLEGWQTRWHVPRPLEEDWTQKVLLAQLPDGDVVAVHDGGYNRIPDPGVTPGLEHFYHAPDHASRLSPDLKSRRWIVEISMNPVDPTAAGRLLQEKGNGHPLSAWAPADPATPWPWSSLGNTHCLDLAQDAKGNVLIAGYSSSRTSQEPWWAPFLLTLSSDGKLSETAFCVNPMSGSGGRLNGLVSDSAIAAVSLAPDGSVLFSGIADGGNTVLRQHPLDYTRPTGPIHGQPFGFRGRTLFWGLVGRLETTTHALAGGDYLFGMVQNRLQPAWATAVQGLPGGQVAATGRNGEGFGPVAGAGASGPGSFIRIYQPDFGIAFSAGFPGTRLLHLAVHGKHVVAVGDTRSPGAFLSNPFQAKMGGQGDGYLVEIETP